MSSTISNAEVVSPARLDPQAGRQVAITVKPVAGESFSDLCHRLARQLDELGAAPLHLLAFGDVATGASATGVLRKAFGRVDWPVTWADGGDCDGKPIAGLQVHAFTGDVERIEHDGRVVASVFTEGGARQCLMGGLTPADKPLSRAEQTLRTLDELQVVLVLAGFELADVVRTWFFLEDILSWYDDFNRARTQVYSGVKFRTGSLPASTGVGAKNPAGAALALAAWAYQPLDNRSRAFEVGSPLQCPAPAYGSSFSRALEISGSAGRQLFISGTASIAPGGATLWQNDIRRQVELTMEVVEAILSSRGFSLADLTRAVAYFKHEADAGALGAWCAERGLAPLPVVASHCAVCRDDLLFELEADAFSARP
jgi:enamine deaminase RidA (YjgF/YER057c/UK114 family)